MRYRKLSADDDYTFGNGQLDFWQDVPDAVSQACKTRILLWLGEWFLDITDGTPFMQGIFGKYSLEQANVTIQDRALGTQGLTNISNFTSSIDPDNRLMSCQFTIDTIYGPTDVDIQNQQNY